jgi:hypothetical protein
MKREDLYKAIDGIDEKYIKEAAETEEQKPGRSVITGKIAVAAAVVAALLLTATPFVIKLAGNRKPADPDGPTVSGSPVDPAVSGTPAGPTSSEGEPAIDASKVAETPDTSKLGWVAKWLGNVKSNENYISDMFINSANSISFSNNAEYNALVSSNQKAAYVVSSPVYTYDYSEGTFSASVLFCLYDTLGNGVGAVEVASKGDGLYYSRYNVESLNHFKSTPDAAFIYIEVDGKRYALDENNKLYYAESGLPAPITVKGDMFKAINNGKLGVTYNSIMSNGTYIGCTEIYKLADSLFIDIFPNDVFTANTEAYSSGGRYASITRIDNSYRFLLEVKGGEKDVSIELEYPLGMNVETVKWMDEETVWGVLHESPSLEVLVVYNDKTGVEYYHGLLFTRDPAGELYYVDPVPHSAQASVGESVVDSKGNVIYTTKPGIHIYRDLAVTEEYLAFYTQDTQADEQSDTTLVVVSRKDLSIVLEIASPKLGRIMIE